MRTLALAILIALGAFDLRAAAQLTYELGGKPTPLAWPAEAFPIPVAIGRPAAQNLPAGEALIRGAFDAWSAVDGSRASFRHTGLTDARAGKDGINVVTINDELFGTSGFLAFTTTWFDERTGELQEVDIQIDSAAVKQGVALQSLVQHEIGHLLGFDHSGVVAAVMYPWVGSEHLAAFDSDDAVALARLYPGDGVARRATVRGTVRSPSGPVFAAHVVAVDRNGAPVTSTLSGPDGSYELTGLAAGAYRLYAEPLDGPVETKNLSGVWRNGTASPFRTVFRDDLTLGDGESRSGFDVDVATLAPELNPRWIGAFAADATEIRLRSTAIPIRPGETIAIAVGGDGFVSGMTTFDVLNPGFSRISEFRYGPNYAWATFRVAPDAPAASVVIIATNGGPSATLTGALRVDGVPPSGRMRLVRR